MPLIKVWCLPETDRTTLSELRQAIVNAVYTVEGLTIKDKNKLQVVFPVDAQAQDDYDEIFIEVTGLFEKRKRTYEVLNSLARTICKTMQSYFPELKSKCFVYPFSREWNGFWSQKPKKM